MTEPLVERSELDAAFTDLARQLHGQGLDGELYVFGGTAMVYLGARDATHDVDSRIDRAHQALLHAAHAVADARRWPRSWLNEQGTAYLPSAHEREPAVVFSAAGLVVRAAAPTVLLAMKASSMRKIDVRDVVFLAEYLDLHTATEIVQIHDEWFPLNPLTEAQLAHLDDVETILTVRASPTIPGLDDLLQRARGLREAQPKGD